MGIQETSEGRTYLRFPADSWTDSNFLSISIDGEMLNPQIHNAEYQKYLLIGDPKISLEEVPSGHVYHLTTTAVLSESGIADIIPYINFLNPLEYLSTTGNVKGEVLSALPLDEFNPSFASGDLGYYHSAVFAGNNVSQNLLESLRNEQMLRPDNLYRMMCAVGILALHIHNISRQDIPFFSYMMQYSGLPVPLFTDAASSMFTIGTNKDSQISWALDRLGITGSWAEAVHHLFIEEPERLTESNEIRLQNIINVMPRAVGRSRTIANLERVPLVLEYDVSKVIPSLRVHDHVIPYLMYSLGRPPSIMMAPKFPSDAIISVRYDPDDEHKLEQMLATSQEVAYWNHDDGWRLRTKETFVPVLPLGDDVPRIDHCMMRYPSQRYQFHYLLKKLEHGEMTFITRDNGERLDALTQQANTLGVHLSSRHKHSITEGILTK